MRMQRVKQDSVTLPGKTVSSIQHEEEERELPTTMTTPDNQFSPSEVPRRPSGEDARENGPDFYSN